MEVFFSVPKVINLKIRHQALLNRNNYKCHYIGGTSHCVHLDVSNTHRGHKPLRSYDNKGDTITVDLFWELNYNPTKCQNPRLLYKGSVEFDLRKSAQQVFID